MLDLYYQAKEALNKRKSHKSDQSFETLTQINELDKVPEDADEVIQDSDEESKFDEDEEIIFSGKKKSCDKVSMQLRK